MALRNPYNDAASLEVCRRKRIKEGHFSWLYTSSMKLAAVSIAKNRSAKQGAQSRLPFRK
jgi:hypothetical protein